MPDVQSLARSWSLTCLYLWGWGSSAQASRVTQLHTHAEAGRQSFRILGLAPQWGPTHTFRVHKSGQPATRPWEKAETPEGWDCGTTLSPIKLLGWWMAALS